MFLEGMFLFSQLLFTVAGSCFLIGMASWNKKLLKIALYCYVFFLLFLDVSIYFSK